ncbi:hypothetical protein PUNSTDRAFT_49539 [Punctularia strigosozonata HHB-11173 SS5]|uniref:uncharacterized protein n=1 Tax=Punctularia strigosozonata (strain HHB-11173) TaxID=741275 RepID=UPI00044162B7|nr:uncharacterized protein PUNSTDRAFT_49539 [Punctularia strigosozonata HHB-11173 SS5]EIN12239.1 hypothetical protein PUNSTDRAFT_49539 [Punctularia strigosozonata HHB-11173 SS5]
MLNAVCSTSDVAPTAMAASSAMEAFVGRYGYRELAQPAVTEHVYAQSRVRQVLQEDFGCRLLRQAKVSGP